MAVIKFLFYLLAYLLIVLGTIVNAFISLPFLIFRQTFRLGIRFYRFYKSYSKNLRISSFRIPFLIGILPRIGFKKDKAIVRKYEYDNLKREANEVKANDSIGIFSKLKYFFFGGIFSALFVFIPLVFYLFISDLPTLDKLSVSRIPQTTKIYDRNGELLYEFYTGQNRTVISLSDLPETLKQATIAIEDQNFYSHPGIDIKGIGRAIISNISNSSLQGGSTITQQLIKSALLTPEPTIKRKIKEAFLAIWAERAYSKNEILELYFNYVPYGGTAWGVEAASETYFGKSVSKVTLSESAFLAGLPRAPSLYSPYINEKNSWKKRQWEVLQAMVRDGYITEKKAYDAYSKELSFASPRTSIKAPHFVMYIKNELVKRYGLYEVERGGLQVTTSLDLGMQRFVEGEVRRIVFENGYLGIGNAASLVTDPENGDILVMVGSKDFFDEQNDGNVNLTTSLRQPGSTIKLVTYAAALENGFTEGSILRDTPITIEIPGAQSYSPVNYDGKYHGMVPLRFALANSYNIPAVRIAEKLGPDLIADYGRKMGISSWGIDNYYGLSITLGGNEVTMIELATVYGIIANKGQKVKIDPILEVKDNSGRVVYKKNIDPEQVINRGVAFILEDILSDDSARSKAFGTNSLLNIPGRRIAVKTGTTDNKRDNWTIGFNKNYVVATWVGNNDNTPLSSTLASGITGAAPLWRAVMEEIVGDSDDSVYIVPKELVSRKCFGYRAYFLSGTENDTACKIERPTPTLAEQ